jgi:hypothetical protein
MTETYDDVRDRLIAVFTSCDTLGQYDVAYEYSLLMLKKYRRSRIYTDMIVDTLSKLTEDLRGEDV